MKSKLDSLYLSPPLTQLKKILFSTSSIALIFLLVKLFGFFEKLVLANYFGTGDDADAYLMAYSIPFALFIVFEEILGPVLVPFFVKKLGKGETESGIKILKKFAVYLFFVLCVISIIGIWQSSWFVSHLAPGFSGEKQALTIKLLESLFVTLLFLGTSSFLTVIYHAYKKFNLPVAARALEKLFIIICILLLHAKYGIYSAVIGCILGVVLRILLLFLKLPFQSLKTTNDETDSIHEGEIRNLMILMLPLLLGVLFSQCSALVDNFVASKLGTGAIAALSYAKKIIDLPVLVVPFSMGIVLLPHFSGLSSPENHQSFADLFERCFKILFMIFAFVTVLVVVFNTSVVRLLFERGEFDASSTHMTSAALLWFAVGLIAFAIEIPLMQSFFALKDTFTPIWVGISCALFNISLTLSLVNYLGFIIVPIALSLQKTLKVSLLLLLLRRKIPLILNNMIKFILKVTANVVLTSLVLIYLRDHFFSFSDLSFIYLVGYIVSGSFLSLMLFAGLSRVLRIREFLEFSKYCKYTLKKRT